MTATAERYADLAGEIGRRPARLGTVRTVAVDGPSGSGKTTFSGRLSEALRGFGVPTAIVHTDDLLNGWEDQFTFWDRLEVTVLCPLRAGRPARYRQYDWAAERFLIDRTVPVPDVLILEGGGSAQTRMRAEATLVIFMTAPAELCWDRALRRDGPGIVRPLRRWIDAERAHFDRDNTEASADLVVDGAPQLRHDPKSEYVRLSRPGE